MPIPQLIFVIFFVWVFLVIALWATTGKKGEKKHKAPYHIPYTFPEINSIFDKTILLQDQEVNETYSKSLEFFKSIEKYVVTDNQKIASIIKKSVQNETIEIRTINYNNIVRGLEVGALGYIRVSFFKNDTGSYMKLLAASDIPLKEEVQRCLWGKILHAYLKYMNLELTNDGYSSVYSKKDEEMIEEYNRTHSFLWLIYRRFNGNTTRG